MLRTQVLVCREPWIFCDIKSCRGRSVSQCRRLFSVAVIRFIAFYALLRLNMQARTLQTRICAVYLTKLSLYIYCASGGASVAIKSKHQLPYAVIQWTCGLLFKLKRQLFNHLNQAQTCFHSCTLYLPWKPLRPLWILHKGHRMEGVPTLQQQWDVLSSPLCPLIHKRFTP